MIRTIITPQQTNISINIPSNYIGKQIEVLLYAIDEVELEKTNAPLNASKYKGIFSKKEGETLNDFITRARNEWERDI